MASGFIAALVGVLVLGFVEGLKRFYPAKRTWYRLRTTRGRLAVKLMRKRFEDTSIHRAPRTLGVVLICLAMVWVAAASLLDKRWYEVVMDVLPYVFIGIALFRTPGAMATIAERMKGYERQAGEDPDADEEDGDGGGGTVEVAL